MGPVVVTCDGCGVRIRIKQPESAVGRPCPRCGAPLVSAIRRALEPADGPGQLDLPIVIAPEDTADAPRAADSVPPPSRSRLQLSAALVLAVPALMLGLWVAFGQGSSGPAPSSPAAR